MISHAIGERSIPPTCWKYGELRDLETVEEDLPADAPGAERRRFPVVFLEAHVVLSGIDAAGLERLQVQVLHLVRRGLQDHLELVVLEQAVRVLAEPAIVGTTRRLDVGDVPVRGTEHAGSVSGCEVPAPTSRSSGCCRRRPFDAQNCESLKMRS